VRALRSATAVLLLAGPTGAGAAPHMLPLPVVEPASGVTFSMNTCFWDPPPSGMFPLHVEIENDRTRAAEWTIRFTASGDFPNFVTFDSMETIAVPPHSARQFDLSVPIEAAITPGMGFTSTLTASIAGPGTHVEPATLFMNRQYLNSTAGERALTSWVGFSESLGTRYWDATKAALLSDGYLLVGSRFDPACLPADWRTYLGFGGLALTADEWRDVTPAARLAVERWIARGGRLWIVGEPGSRRTIGFGFVQGLAGSDDLRAKTLAEIIRETPTSTDDYQSWALVAQLPSPEFPKGLMLLFIAGFGLLIGPVNLFAFCRGRHRYRVLWTTPLLSVAASSVITLGILAYDGTGGTGTRQALVWLLPDRHEELLLQEQLARTGLLMSSRFQTSEPVWMEPLSLTERSFAHGASRVHRRGDTFSGEWFNSRSRHAQYIESIRPSRARFEMERANASVAPRLTSSVPDTLDDVRVVDDGRCWRASGVVPGRAVTLAPETIEDCRSWLASATPYYGPRLRRALPTEGGIILASARKSAAPMATLGSLRWNDRETLYVQRLNDGPGIAGRAEAEAAGR
jgi:hypothetical protein